MTSSAGLSFDVALRGFQYKHGDRPLDGFTIQRAAGRGGFGEVYYAVSDGGREVALKLVHTYEQIELRGIAHCMNLKSPHLVTIFDVKYGLDGRPWVIMEFVSGPSLRELIDAAPSGLGVPKAAFFLREIAKSLTYLHDCGIVHRDLKPGNIFYENGYVKIGDYGLSKAILAGQTSAQTVTVGTVHYMAPEIGEGRYDKGVDLYALGALLYEMLTGQVPFFGASPTEVLMKHLSAQVDLSGVDEPFATVIRKAMAKNPADRYQSAQEMVEAVFGAEHVRNSVSHFAPESLSLVAGHAARRIPAEPALRASSGVTSQGDRDPWGQFGTRLHRLFNHGVEAAIKPCRRIGRRLEQFMNEATAKGTTLAAPPPTLPPPAEPRPAHDVIADPPVSSGAAVADPISTAQRRALAAAVIGLVALAAGASARTGGGAATTMFVLLAAAGGTFGVRFAARRIAPGLPAEPRVLGRLAVGGFAGLCTVLSSLPVALESQRITHPDQAWPAILACLFILDWRRRVGAGRPARLEIAPVLLTVLCGAILAAIFGGSAPIVAGVVGGIALAAQLASPWNAVAPVGGARAGSEPGPERPATPFPAAGGEVGPRLILTQAAGAPVPAGPVLPPHAVRAVHDLGRVAWLILFTGAATLGLFLAVLLVANVRLNPDERAMAFGFAIVSLILAGFCLRRSSATTTFAGFWPSVFRPLLQIACVGSVVVALSYLALGRPYPHDVPPIIFAIVFPSVAWVALTFFFRTGDTMSHASPASPASPAFSPSHGPAASFPAADFSLARVAGGAGRLVVSAAAMALLFVAVLLAVAVVADLPGLFNSPLVPDRLGRDLRRTFGNADWARLARVVASAVSFFLAIAAVGMLMQVRRRLGVLHMLRATAAAALLFASVILLGRGLPAWSDLVPTANGWELVDQYVRQISDTRAIASAAALLIVALFLLLWPARRASANASSNLAQELPR